MSKRGFSRLPAPLVKLPLLFDHERMLQEVRQFPRHEWRPERFNVLGYWALNLVSFEGQDNDRQDAPMRPTARLRKCPYLQQVFGTFESPLAEVRLRWLERPAELVEHYDDHFLWQRRLRIHLPVVTNPSATFSCDGHEVHMAAGEAWAFDRLRPHKMTMMDRSDRIHITLDVTPSSKLWDLIQRGTPVPNPNVRGASAPHFVPYRTATADGPLLTETEPAAPVIHPAELELFANDNLEGWESWPEATSAQIAAVRDLLGLLSVEWRNLWVQYGSSEEGRPRFQQLVCHTWSSVLAIPGVLAVSPPQWSPIVRLFNFFRTGIFRPEPRGTSPEFDSGRLLASPLTLAQEGIVFRLETDGRLSLNIPSTDDYRECSPWEVDFLSHLSEPGSANDAAQLAGATLSETDLRARVKEFLDASILVAAHALPILDVRFPSQDSEQTEQTTPPDRPDAKSQVHVSSADRFRLKQAFFFRLKMNGVLGLWLNQFSQYQESSPQLIAFLVQLARGATLEKAAMQTGVASDEDVMRFVGIVQALGLIEKAEENGDPGGMKRSGFEIAQFVDDFPDIGRREEEFLHIYGKCKAYTLTSIPMMYATYCATRYVSHAHIFGDVVECGVWRGGSMMLSAFALMGLEDCKRRLFLYDTFECAWEAPTEHDGLLYETESPHLPARARGGQLPLDASFKARTSLENVSKNLGSTGYPLSQTVLVKGFVQDTIPATIPDKIALLRLDTDLYESTYHALVHLYPRLAPNGVIIIDDYGKYRGATEAVDRYFKEQGVKILLNRVDIQGRVGIKPSPQQTWPFDKAEYRV